MQLITRRRFLRSSLAATAFLAVAPPVVRGAANEKVIVGVIGTGGRGTALARFFASRADTEIAYVCDADSRRMARAQKVVAEAQGRSPKMVQDFRRMLEDAAVDAIINATPDHWHALGTILACQAGKDVYVEKPLAHNLWEGRQMIRAARRYKRVVQVGTQSRSAPYVQEAVELVRGGRLGEVYLVRVFNMMRHAPMQPGPDQPVPEGFDYNLWCGPAAKLPYNPRRRWLNFFEYSCGPIPGDAIHQLDLARLLMGDPPAPRVVSHHGGIRALRDGRDTPDTQMALYEYDGWTLAFEASLWTPYIKKIPVAIRDSDRLPDWPFTSTRIEVLGTQGFMYLGRHGGGWQLYDADGKLVRTQPGRQADREHQENFIASIRSRHLPNADVAIAHQSTLLCHLANAAFRSGQPSLVFDPQTEQFTDHPEANAFLKRSYRKPWVVPEQV